MNKNRQLGALNVQVIIAVIFLTVIAGLLWDRHSLKVDNKQLTADLATTKTALDEAKDANNSLKLDLKLSGELSDASKNQAVTHQAETKAQDKKFTAIEKKLPVAVKSPTSAVESPESLARNTARITLLWEGFCVDNPNENCVVKEKEE